MLLHGARVPGIASFDLPVPGGSLAEDLAAPDRSADLRSRCPRATAAPTGPPAMSRPPEESQPLSRSHRGGPGRRRGGAAWCWRAPEPGRSPCSAGPPEDCGPGQYASLWPERVGHLVLLNALYGGSAVHPMFGPGSSLADPAHPDRLSPDLGGYARADAASLLRPWDRSRRHQTRRRAGTLRSPRPTSERRWPATRLAARTSPPVAPRTARRARGQLLPGVRTPAL